MKKTFSAFVLALACVATIVVAIYIPAFRNVASSASTIRPIAEEVLIPRSTIAQLGGTLPHAGGTFAGAGKPSVNRPRGARRGIRGLPEEVKSRERIAAKLVSWPAVFEPAASNGAQFVGRANGMDVALTGNGIIVDVRPAENSRAAPNRLAIRVRGTGGLVWHGSGKARGESNYFVGSDPRAWRTHVARFKRVETANARGPGLAVYGGDARSGQGIEYDVRLNAGADPAKVRLELNGARDVRLDGQGDLVMRVGGRELRMKAPAIYERVSTLHASSQRRRKMTSSPHPRKSTSTHSRSRSPRGTRPPRASTRGTGGTRLRVRPSMQARRRSTRKKRTKKKPALPLGDNSAKSGTRKSKAPPSDPHESGHRIDGGYVLEADGSIGFWVGKHDQNAALIIDPSIALTYASFLGGTGADSVNGMAIDASGNVFVAGTTTSAASFPEAANGVEGSVRGASQLFLAKIAFSPSGTGALQYVTFFGGSDAQAGGKVAVDTNGNAAILGTTTSADYPVTDGRTATQGLTAGTGNDLVVSEVDATGSNLIFSTIFGGNGTQSANAAAGIPLSSSLNIPAGQGGVAFDATGNVYVASDTTSTDLPTTGGAYQSAFGGKDSSDGFIAEFQVQGVGQGASDLLYCSYLGTNSDGEVAVGGLAVDSSTPPGVYIAGATDNSVDGFPIEHAFQPQYAGGLSDAFVMKMQLAGTGASDLLYATLLGGSGMDEALSVAVDSQGSAYVAGATQSVTFPTIPTPTIAGPSMKLYQPDPAPPPGFPPIQNAFVAAIGWNPGQTVSLQYFTYLGGSGQDAAESVSVPSAGSVYVSGTTTSYNFGWHDNLQPFNGSADGFVAKLNTMQPGTASLLYATPLGGTFLTPGAGAITFGNGIAADGRGNVYLAGQTTTANFPTAMTTSSAINGFQQIFGSCQEHPTEGDAFIAGIQEGAAARPAVSFGSTNINFGGAGVQIGTEATPAQIFTVANTGETNLNFSATQPLTITGPNSGDFPIIASGCTQSLAPGQNCQVELGFVPSAAGAEGAFASVVDDAPGSPQLLEVTGTGVGPLTVSPANFAYGTVPLGDTATKHDIKVTITAGNQVNSLSFMLSGADTAQFTWLPLGTACSSGIALDPGTSCDIWYAFTPNTTGTFHAELDIECDVASGTPITEKLPLTGTAVEAVPVPIAAPTQLLFRSEPLGSSETLPVLVSNTGTAPLVLTQQIGVAGTNASNFSQTTTCGMSIAPDSSCTVYVQFAPQTIGSKIASLTITDNAPGGPQLVALSGTGVAPPQAHVSPTSWNFGSQNVGTQSPAEMFTITNMGSASLNLTQGIGIAGTNAADFEQTNDCAISVAPGSSCNISVTFSPQSGGARSASIDIANNAPGSPQSVPLAGTGVLSAEAQVSPVGLTFGSQVIATSSEPQSVSVKNTGSAPLTFNQIAFTGPSAGDFTESDNCAGNEIAPNLSCTIFVRFAPQSVGSKTASLAITDNAPNSPQSVSVIGTATQPASIQVTPTALNFAAQSVGTISPPQTVSIGNQGTVPITFTQGANSIAIGGPDPSDFSETSNCSMQSGLQAASGCTVNIVFAPTSGGTRTATLSIADSAPGSPQTIALSGTSVQANAQIAPTALPFNGQSVSTTSPPQTIEVTSIGPGQPLNVARVSFAGANAADFAETDNCGGPITSSCAINVTFTPVCANEPASRSATLTIQDNGSTPSQTVSLTGSATGDFCISGAPNSLIETVAAGTTAVFPPTSAPQISIISVGSFSGTVNLVCSTSPPGPTCTFSPSAAITVSPNLPAQFQVEAATSDSASGIGLAWPKAGNWSTWLFSLIIALLGLIAVTHSRRQTRRQWIWAGAIFAALCLVLAACGGGGGAGPNVSSDPPPPLAGAYTLTVTANNGNETQTLSLHLNVTP